MNKAILRRCTLFSDTDDATLAAFLELLEARESRYVRGDFVHAVYTSLTAFGLVLEGHVQVLRDDRQGHHMIMATVGVGETFGESLCYLRRTSPVYIQAVEDCRIMWLSTARLSDPSRLADPALAALSCRFTAMLAERALNMNSRIQIMSQLTIRAKIMTLLTDRALSLGSNSFSLPFDREDMAFYLGTDRSALSRELGRMRREGLIGFKGNHFTLQTPIWRESAEDSV